MTGRAAPRRKIVALLTYGTRGDVEPFVALAAGLRAAGYEPRLAGPEGFASLAVDRGIAFQPLPGDLPALVRSMVTEAGTNWPRMVVALSRFIAPLAAQAYRILIEWASDADLVVSSFLMTRAGYEIGGRKGRPCVSAQFFPVFAPTAAFPAPVFPDWSLGGGYRRLTHKLVTQVFRRGGDLLYRRARREDPSLPPLSEWPFDAVGPSRPPILFAFSPHVIPPPREWRGLARVTGYWPLAAAPDWSPPIELERFLDHGDPPVYVGLGSGGSARAGAWASAAREALERVGVRGLLDVGEAGVPIDPLPPSILVVRSLPHAWLFPRVAAVVHHGGAGTTGAGLTAGKPTLILPTASDQPFWGRRVHQLGVGPAPIPLRRLSVPRLAQALESLGERDMRSAAARLGERIRTDDGVGEAVRIIAEMLGAEPGAGRSA